MNSDKVSYGNVGFTGILAVAVVIFSWLFAASIDTTWVFGEDMMSDLGVSSFEGAKMLFNLGFCLMGGVLTAIFGILFACKNDTVGGTSFGVIIAFAGICLMGIGIFTSDSTFHTPIASALGVFALFAVIVMTIQNWADKKMVLGGVGFVAIVIVAYMALTSSMEMFEPVCSILAIIYIGIQSMAVLAKA